MKIFKYIRHGKLQSCMPSHQATRLATYIVGEVQRLCERWDFCSPMEIFM
jgi:hypothetical protein